jgi:hypothetical protein
MKNARNIFRILGALAITAFSTPTLATSYDVTFDAATPDDTVATGVITVSGGVATSGSLDVASGPDVGTYTLVPGGGGDSLFDWDSIVTPGGPSFVDSTGGLLWSTSGTAGNSEEINLWFNPVAEWGAPADSYSLWGGSPNGYDLEANGSATLAPANNVFNAGTPSAPDGCWTAALLAGAIAGVEVLRRSQKQLSFQPVKF